MKIKIHRPIIILAFYLISFFTKLIPLKSIYKLGSFFGNFSFLILRSKKKIIYKNLKTAFPEWKEEKIKRCIKENFKHYGITFFELFKLKHLIKNVKTEGLEKLNERPCILITGHIGNWELMAQTLSKNGVPLHVIAKKVYLSPLNKFLVNLRKKGNINVILRDKEKSPGLILKAIREKNVLGFLIDQDTKVESILVPFFGVPASTPVGPVLIALKKRIPIVFGYLVRKGTFNYSMELKKIEIENKDVKEITIELTKELESIIRKYPSQWVWIHKRWKKSITY